VIRLDDMIVLKQVSDIDGVGEDIELNRIWDEIDSGECKSYFEEAFFDEIRKW